MMQEPIKVLSKIFVLTFLFLRCNQSVSFKCIGVPESIICYSSKKYVEHKISAKVEIYTDIPNFIGSIKFNDKKIYNSCFNENHMSYFLKYYRNGENGYFFKFNKPDVCCEESILSKEVNANTLVLNNEVVKVDSVILFFDSDIFSSDSFYNFKLKFDFLKLSKAYLDFNAEGSKYHRKEQIKLDTFLKQCIEVFSQMSISDNVLVLNGPLDLSNIDLNRNFELYSIFIYCGNKTKKFNNSDTKLKLQNMPLIYLLANLMFGIIESDNLNINTNSVKKYKMLSHSKMFD